MPIDASNKNAVLNKIVACLPLPDMDLYIKLLVKAH